MTDAYEAWLNKYTTSIAQQDVFERAEDQRIDYHHPSQTYADYLDYVEEWEWHADEKRPELLTRVIYTMSHKHVRLACRCRKEHVLTTNAKPNEGDVIVDEIGANLNTKCWFHTVSEAVGQSMKALKDTTMKMANPLEEMLVKFARLRMVADGMTPTLLPYDAFRILWWKQESDVQARHLLNRLDEPLRKAVVQRLNDYTPKVEKKEILLFYPQSDHGLHALHKALDESDFRRVLSLTNRLRKKIDPTTEHVSYRHVIDKEAECEFCANNKQPHLSVFGVYYAPPGAGKTTAQNRELFVGFDTDWIGLGFTWRDVVLLFKLGIPIITNQEQIFFGSGIKVFGIAKAKIRRGLDTISRIRESARNYEKDFGLQEVQKKEYMSDWILRLQISSIIQQMVINYSFNQMPFYRNLIDDEWTRKFPKAMRTLMQTGIGEKPSILL